MKDELLVRAAQANGHAYPWTMPNGFGERPWNPLTNNEDALVLAVRIGLQVTAYPMYDEPKHSVIVRKPVWDHDAQEGDGVEVVEPYGTDALAATRRAITMCAAELARRKTPNVAIEPRLPGGRVMSWLNGTSTEWRAADRDAPHHGRITTAAMLAISSPGTGATCELTDCGNIVSTWYYNGTYWVPFGGEQKSCRRAHGRWSRPAAGGPAVVQGPEFECLGEPSLCANPRGCACVPDSKTPNVNSATPPVR